ncbi:unnamed protein product [Heligmosomoides polygyrus]|uniref:DUF3480 domain-containing protein n=1 Tax=Heligmosomoides polygyrus TaxID=6339 RepID=A0A183GSJ1_HELPZ|nr:unnamed protein product [Heligmosomoides polygyrus]
MERMMNVVYGMPPQFDTGTIGLLAGRLGLCANFGCSLNGVDVNRAKHSQRAEVHLLNIVPQLEDVISTHFSQLVGIHARIHDQETPLRTDRSDVHFFKQFMESVESLEEYGNRHMKVMLTLSTDGFKPKRISRLEIELHSLEENPLAIEFGGEVWRVSVALFRGVADMAAQNVLFGIPRWNLEFGCSKCLLRGTRFGNHRLWIAEQRVDVVLRTPDSYLNDGQLGVNGLPNLFTGDSRFPQLRVSNAIIGMLKQSLLRTKSHTHCNSLILSLEDLPVCTASEMDEIAFFVFPLVAAIDAIPDQIAAISLIGYWQCLRILASSWQLSEEKISAAQHTANVTKQLCAGA